MLANLPYLSLGLFAVAATTATAQTLQVLPHCDADSACVEMTLDVVRPAVLRVVRPQDAYGYTMFELLVHGALTGGPEAEYRLQIPGYTDGIACSHFGQATAAVVGHGPDGQPILLTDRGPLEVHDSILQVGCPDCARVRDVATRRLVATRRTPGWDLSLVGTRADSLLLADNGELVVRTRGRFLRLSAAGPFRWVPQPRPTRRYRLQLASGGCS